METQTIILIHHKLYEAATPIKLIWTRHFDNDNELVSYYDEFCTRYNEKICNETILPCRMPPVSKISHVTLSIRFLRLLTGLKLKNIWNDNN